MWDGDNEDGWCRELAGKRRCPGGPQPIAEVLSRLMARRGYAQVQSSVEWARVWQEAAGSHLAGDSRVGGMRGGVLEIVVRNSSVAQEAGFQKNALLGRVRELASGHVVRDLRFRVGDLE